ncbi:MAG: hypothetical protein AAGG68_10315 [Bacteroidota bacterium]
MLEQITIPKLPNSSFPEHVSFEHLRKLGLEHIERLGSAIWTDYNIHDPGITILEVLCYALTDLGYRTQFDIKDLLTQKTGSEENNFFTACQILTCNPVTVNDFRRLLIDLPGVRNAWLEAADRGECPIYLDNKAEQEDGDPTARFYYETIANNELKINGLYNVCIEFEDQLILSDCGQPIDTRSETLDEVYAIMNAHRNLCEDLKEVIFFGKEGIAICADIELTADANVNEVMLEIYKQVEEFLAPTLHFYTLQELLAKGKSVEEIYEGRPLKKKSHGFIDSDDLERLNPRKKIYTSDIINIVMDIPGVLAIRRFLLVNYIDDIAYTKGEPWCLPLHDKYMPHFDFDNSSINFYKGVLPQRLDEHEVRNRYTEEKLASNKSLLNAYDLDLEVPRGTFRADLSEYTSIQEDFPITYGIGEEGLKDIASAQRKAEAKQLKAYLLFFDQILANYLSQLANVRDLFSIKKTDGNFKRGSGLGTYAAQSISSITGVSELITNPNDCPTNDSDGAPPDDYFQYLNYISENEDTFYQRKNEFLDHILARFGESFSDYVLLVYEADGARKKPEKIIEDKSKFLKNYPDISRNRGKAFDYYNQFDHKGAEISIWDTPNVAGFKKRVSRLLGIDGHERGTLAPIKKRNDGSFWQFQIPEEKAILCSKKYENEAEIIEASEAIIPLLCEEKYYRRLTCTVHNEFEYRFLIVDEAGNCIAESIETYTSEIERDADIQRLLGMALYGSEIICETNQATECYFYNLKDYLNGNLLLKSQKGYESESEASEKFATLLTLAADPQNYCKSEEEDTFSFKITETEGIAETELYNDKTITAFHTTSYASKLARDYWMESIFYYLNTPQVADPFIDGKPGTFQFEIRFEDFVIFQGVPSYLTELEAHKAAHKVLKTLARHRVYYHLLDQMDSNLPHGFELLDRKGTVLATHPHQYATACERNLMVDNLLYCLNDELPEMQLLEVENMYFFELRNEVEGAVNTVLMRSVGAFKTEEEAQTAWNEFIGLAMEENNYEAFEEGEKYRFRLNNLSGDAIAVHPESYENEVERDMALQAVLHRICRIRFEVGTMGEDGQLKVKLLVNLVFDESEDAILLLESTSTYTDHIKAKEAFKNMLLWAQERSNYSPTANNDSNFTVALRTPSGDLFATSSVELSSVEEREAFIEMLINYVRKDELQWNISNETGAFFVQINDEKEEHPLLIGTEILPTEKAVEARTEELLAYAGQYDNYLKDYIEGELCPYRIALKDEKGEIIATHPKKYTSEEARNAALSNLFIYLTDGTAIADEVVYPKYAYRYEIKDAADEVILSSVEHYKDDATAIETFQAHSLHARNTANYQVTRAEGLYGIQLFNNEDRLIAEQAPVYAEQSDAERVIAELIFYLLTRGTTYKIRSNEEGLFQIALLYEEADFLVTPFEFESENQAKSVLLLFISSAKKESYEKTVDEAGCNFGFVLKDEEDILANSAITYPDAESRDAALTAFLAYLNTLEIESCIRAETVSYGYALYDFQDKLLIRSKRENFPTAEEAKMDYLDNFLPYALREENYLLFYDNDQCTYTFELVNTKGQAIGIYDFPFPNRSERAKHIKYLIALLQKYEVNTSVEGTGCGHFYTLRCEGDLLEGQLFYPSKLAAERACNKLKENLLDSENYIPKEDSLEVWKDDQLILRSSTEIEEDFAKTFIQKLEVPKAIAIQALEDQVGMDYFVLLEPKKEEAAILLQEKLKKQQQEEGTNTEKTQNALTEKEQQLEEEARCNEFLESLQNRDNFCLLTDEDACFYGFDLVNEDGELIATHGTFYESKETRDEQISVITNLGNQEGMHLIEHLLLRPKSKGNFVEEQHTFEVSNGEQLVLLSDCVFNKKDNAETAFDKLNDIIDSYQLDKTENQSDTAQELTEEDSSNQSFQFDKEENPERLNILGDDNRVLAYQPCLDKDQTIAEIVEELQSYELTPSYTQTPAIHEVADTLMNPIMDGCTLGELTPRYSDPYSFRATVVLPYWPARFQNWEFRTFVEQTLRREAPAHIYLRICWISGCQMQEFEQAYCAWLEAQRLGETSCNRTEALNNLIDILSKLKNIYPEANLFACEGEDTASDSIYNPIVLNHTVLGTA